MFCAHMDVLEHKYNCKNLQKTSTKPHKPWRTWIALVHLRVIMSPAIFHGGHYPAVRRGIKVVACTMKYVGTILWPNYFSRSVPPASIARNTLMDNGTIASINNKSDG